MKSRKNETLIGFFFIVALVLLYLGYNFLKGTNVFQSSSIYYTTFQNLNNVNVATPIKISGYKVGKVGKVSFNFQKGKGATLTLLLNPDVVLTKGTKITIAGNPLTGSELIILPPIQNDGPTLNPGDNIPSIEGAGDLLQIAQKSIVPLITDILPTLTKTVERINAIVSSKDIDAAMVNFQHTTKSINDIVTRIDQSSRILPSVMAKANKISDNVLTVSNEMKKIKLDTLINSLNAMSISLKEVVLQLKTKDNTAGLLINDKGMYEHINKMIQSTDSLVSDIKKHPKRYLNISLF